MLLKINFNISGFILMKLTKIIILTSGLLLTACNTTQEAKRTVEYPSAEDKRQKDIKTAQSRIEQQGMKESLAVLYLQSDNLEERKKSLPMLKEIAKNGNKDALWLLASSEFNGKFGYLSSDSLVNNRDVILSNFANELKRLEDREDLWRRNYAQDPDKLNHLYDKYSNLCTQPLDEMPNSLSEAQTPHMQIMYVRSCIDNYTHNNSTKKHLALADFQKSLCSFAGDGKICLENGYRSLASGILENNDLISLAYALISEYRLHKEHLPPPMIKTCCYSNSI